MSTGVSSPLGSLELDPDGASPWGDERSINTHSPASSLNIRADDALKDDAPAARAGGSADTAVTISPVGEETPSKPNPSTPGSARRGPRRPGRHVVRAEAISDDLGPLGPLGDNLNESSEPSTPLPSSSQEIPPQPPVKEASPHVARLGTSNTPSKVTIGDILDNVALGSDENDVRRLPGVMPQRGEGSDSQLAATKPTFEISVGDPHKVGDLTSAHTVYAVRTRVRLPLFYMVGPCGLNEGNRLLLRLSGFPSLRSRVDIAISCGSTKSSTAITPVLLCRLLQRSRLSGGLMRISWSRVERH
jgi:sorting nexin-1/2